MKYIPSLLGLIIMPCLLMAQSEYALFPIDSVLHAGEHLEFPTVQLSSIQSGGYTHQKLHPNYNKDFHDPTEGYTDLLGINLPYQGCINWELAHWFGGELKYDSNGVYHFENRMGTPIYLNSRDTVGSTQPIFIYEYGDWDMLEASIDSVVWNNFGDITDSIKYFTLTRLDSNYNMVPDSINGTQILLSKSHGLLQTPAFFDFPFKQKIMTYQAKYGADTNIENSNRYKVFNMEVGDEFHTLWKAYDAYPKDHKKEIIITSKDWNPSEQRFIYGKHIKHEKTFNQWDIDEDGNYYYYDEVEFSETNEIDTFYLSDYLYLDEVLFGIPNQEELETDTLLQWGFSAIARGKSSFNDSLFKVGFQSHHYFNNTGLKWCEYGQSSSGDPAYFIEGSGGIYLDVFHETGGYYIHILTYIYKGNYEWGDPFNLSVDEPEENNFVLYPNPTSGWVYISIDQQTSGKLRLIDLSGRSLAEMECNAEQTTYTLDVSDYAPGIYFIEYFSKGKKLIAEKLILQ